MAETVQVKTPWCAPKYFFNDHNCFFVRL